MKTPIRSPYATIAREITWGTMAAGLSLAKSPPLFDSLSLLCTATWPSKGLWERWVRPASSLRVILRSLTRGPHSWPTTLCLFFPSQRRRIGGRRGDERSPGNPEGQRGEPSAHGSTGAKSTQKLALFFPPGTTFLLPGPLLASLFPAWEQFFPSATSTFRKKCAISRRSRGKQPAP